MAPVTATVYSLVAGGAIRRWTVWVKVAVEIKVEELLHY
jgi:hypothetical protein